MNASEIIALLDLKPHPEGGQYRETFRDTPGGAGRSQSTAIFYLLEQHERSNWHRIDAAEIWHWYFGSALELRLSPDGKSVQTKILGCGLERGERPQLIVPQRVWQTARPQGPFALVGCTVAPGFEFSGFELAPENWLPN